MDWFKSVRSISAVLIILAVVGGLFTGKLSADNFMQIATVITTAYFVKERSNGTP